MQLRYVKETIDSCIAYSGDDSMDLMPIAYSDSDWDGKLTPNRLSIGAHVIMLAGGPISRRCFKEQSIAVSTNEAEYVAASETAREVVWMRNILRELNVLPATDDEKEPFPPMPMHVDNEGAKELINNSDINKKSRHIDIRYHYAREKAAEKQLMIVSTHTNDQAADGLTKPLSPEKFARFLELIDLRSLSG